jgi:uncharacterized protein
MASATVVIPALDEAGSLGAVLQAIPRDLVGEVIVVDGGSVDGTTGVAAAHSHPPHHRGSRPVMSVHHAVRSVVVIMAKQPVPGRTKTRLSPPLSPLEAARLSEALLNDTIGLVSRVQGVRLALAITPAAAIESWRPELPGEALLLAVEGADIGVCLSEATGRLFASGYTRVIALNSDGPTLPPARVEQAEALLACADVVVGPSEDGGYYLVGLRRPEPALFRDIAWSTPHVMAQTLERAAALRCSVALLAPWYRSPTSPRAASSRSTWTRFLRRSMPGSIVEAIRRTSRRLSKASTTCRQRANRRTR